MKIDPNDTKKIEAAVRANENPDEKKTEKPSSGFSAIKQKLSALFEKKTAKAQTEQKEKRVGEKTRPQGLKLNAKVLKTILIGFVSLTVLAMLYGVFKQRSLSFGGAQSEERLMTSVSPITIGQNDRIRSSGEGKTETVYINQGGGQNPAASGSAPTGSSVNPSQTAAATPDAAAQPFSAEVSRGNVTPAVIAEQTAPCSRAVSRSALSTTGRKPTSPDQTPPIRWMKPAVQASTPPASTRNPSPSPPIRALLPTAATPSGLKPPTSSSLPIPPANPSRLTKSFRAQSSRWCLSPASAPICPDKSPPESSPTSTTRSADVISSFRPVQASSATTPPASCGDSSGLWSPGTASSVRTAPPSSSAA